MASSLYSPQAYAAALPLAAATRYHQQQPHPPQQQLPSSLAEWRSNVMDTMVRPGSGIGQREGAPAHQQAPSSALRRPFASPSVVPAVRSTETGAAEQLSVEYHALLSRVALQSAQLASLQSEVGELHQEKASKEELLKVCAEGLEGVWEVATGASAQQTPEEKEEGGTPTDEPQGHLARRRRHQHSPARSPSQRRVQSHSRSRSPPVGSPTRRHLPGSTARSSAHPSSAHIACLLRSLTTAASASSSSSSSAREVRELFLQVATELESVVSHARGQADAGEERYNEVLHRLAQTMEAKRHQRQQTQVLHQWQLASTASQSSDLVLRAHDRTAGVFRQARSLRAVATLFHSWKQHSRRRKHTRAAGRLIQLSRRTRALREMYFVWRLRLLARSRDQAMALQDQLTRTLENEKLSDGSRTALTRTVVFYQFKIWLAWVHRMKHQAQLVRASRRRRLLVAWAQLAAGRTLRKQALLMPLRRLDERRKKHALDVWSTGIQKLHQKRLHVLAALVESLEQRALELRWRKLTRGWTKWHGFVRWKREKASDATKAAEARETDEARAEKEAQVHVELQHQQAAHARELAAQEHQFQLEQSARDALVRSQCEDAHRESVAQLEAQALLASERWAAEMAALRTKHEADLQQVRRQADGEIRARKDQIEELQLAQKHIVLEMKHQERVHSDQRQELKERKRAIAVEENVSGVKGHLVSDATCAQHHACASHAHHCPSISPCPVAAAGTHVTSYGGSGVPIILPYPVPPAAPAVREGDPYLSSPVYHHHIQQELATAAKAELHASQLNEKALLQQVADLKAQCEKLRGAYQAEHKALKACQHAQTESLLEQARTGTQDQARVWQEIQALREEAIGKAHQLDLVQVECEQAREKCREQADRLEALKRNHGAHVADLERQLEATRIRLDQEVTARQEEERALSHQGDARLHQMREEHARQLAEVRATSEAALASAHAHAAETLASARADAQQRLDQAERQWRERVAEEQRRRDQEAAERSGEVERMHQEHARAVREHEERWTQEDGRRKETLQQAQQAAQEKLHQFQQEAQARLQQVQREAADGLGRSEADLKQAQERLVEVDAQLRALTEANRQCDLERVDLLDRNRKLAAALVEHRTTTLGGGGVDDHTHFVGLNEAAIIAGRMAERTLTQHQHQANRRRPPTGHQTNGGPTTAGSSSGFLAAPSSSSSTVSSSSGELLHPHSHSAHLLPFHSVPTGGTRLSLTPITHLAFSPPATPPLNNGDPWPTAAKVRQEHGGGTPTNMGQEEEEDAPGRYGGYELNSASGVGGGHHGGGVETAAARTQAWLRSPIVHSSAFTPTSLGRLAVAPYTTGRRRADHDRPSASESPFAPQASASASLYPRTRPLTGTSTLFSSPRGSNAAAGASGVNTSAADIAGLFQRGLQQLP